MTPAERKRLQRERDRIAGWVEVTVRVAADQAQVLRDYAASLPLPLPPADPRQLELIDRIEDELRRDKA